MIENVVEAMTPCREGRTLLAEVARIGVVIAHWFFLS